MTLGASVGGGWAHHQWNPSGTQAGNAVNAGLTKAGNRGVTSLSPTRRSPCASAMCSNARLPSGSRNRCGGEPGRADRRPEGPVWHPGRGVVPGAGGGYGSVRPQGVAAAIAARRAHGRPWTRSLYSPSTSSGTGWRRALPAGRSVPDKPRSNPYNHCHPWPENCWFKRRKLGIELVARTGC